MIDLKPLPRVTLSHLPTPIETLPRLSEALGGPRLYVKRDDCTGLATGGNKTRKLEFLLGEAMAQGADVIVTMGAIQSNHARLTAAAAARLGLRSVLLLQEAVPWDTETYHRSGNRLIERLMGTEVRLVAQDADLDREAATLAAALRAEGHHPYVIGIGGSSALGTLGYVACAQELARQAAARGLAFDRLVVASGSGGTQAGLVLGCLAAGLGTVVEGVTVSRGAAAQCEIVRRLAGEAARLAGADIAIPEDAVRADDRHYRPAYGIPNEAVREALGLCARLEGLLLDPVYTGKAMAGLIAAVRSGRFGRDETVLFLHTGGQVGLFAYEEFFQGA